MCSRKRLRLRGEARERLLSSTTTSSAHTSVLCVQGARSSNMFPRKCRLLSVPPCDLFSLTCHWTCTIQLIYVSTDPVPRPLTASSVMSTIDSQTRCTSNHHCLVPGTRLFCHVDRHEACSSPGSSPIFGYLPQNHTSLTCRRCHTGSEWTWRSVPPMQDRYHHKSVCDHGARVASPQTERSASSLKRFPTIFLLASSVILMFPGGCLVSTR